MKFLFGVSYDLADDSCQAFIHFSPSSLLVHIGGVSPRVGGNKLDLFADTALQFSGIPFITSVSPRSF